MKSLNNWIDNTFVSLGAECVVVSCPATGAGIAQVPLSDKSHVQAAVASSLAAFEIWRYCLLSFILSKRTVKDRVQILLRFHQLVVKHANELAQLIVLEHGKVWDKY